MHEMMAGKRPFVNPDEVCRKRIQFPLNLSWNAVSILQGVSIIFLLLFNCVQVVVVGFTSLWHSGVNKSDVSIVQTLLVHGEFCIK